MRARRPLLAALALALAACDRAPAGALTRCEATQVVSAAVKTDILFVVDDSQSMQGAQNNLQTNFQAFVDRLASSPVKNDFQIGVTTTSMHRYAAGPPASYPSTFLDSQCPGLYPASTPYPQGALVSVKAAPSSTGDPSHRVQSTTGTSPPRILVASSPTLVADFTQNAFVGVCGSGKEQGLEAAKVALDDAGPGGPNDGFLRPGARLAVIIVSDDDDCSDPLHQGTSGEPTACTSYAVQNYVDYFQAPIDGESRPVVFGLIVAVDPTSLQPVVCTEPAGNPVEYPAYRYRAFADAFGAHALVDSICKTSFHDTLVAIAGLIDPGQVMPLQGTPADWRMLVVGVERGSATIPCTVRDAGSPDQATADVVYTPPSLAGQPATLTFQNGCRLQQGDRARIDVVCAG